MSEMNKLWSTSCSDHIKHNIMSNIFSIVLPVTIILILGTPCHSSINNATMKCENLDTHKTWLHLGSKTPYLQIHHNRKNRGAVMDYNLPKECLPHQMWMLIRHGTRNPSTALIKKMNDLLPVWRSAILHANESTLCDEELDGLRGWTEQLGKSDEKILVREGEEEMMELAKRMLSSFPELITENYSNNTYKFRYTDTQRTRESARYFARGLFGCNSSRDVWYPKPLEKDPILRFYKLCSKWKLEVDENPEKSLRELRDLKASSLYNSVKESVAKRLGLPDLSFDDMHLLYRTCSFESSSQASTSSPSPWCAAFSISDLQVMEYAEDLEYYWVDGYGFDVNHKQACPPVVDMIKSFQSATKSESPKGIFHFSHSGALLKVLAHLGLFRDDEPLFHSNFDKHRENRKWRVGHIGNFASNLGAILYRCGNENPDYRVMMLHQERPIALPGCPLSEDHTPLCPLQTLVDQFLSCDFQTVCKHDKSEL